MVILGQAVSVAKTVLGISGVISFRSIYFVSAAALSTYLSYLLRCLFRHTLLTAFTVPMVTIMICSNELARPVRVFVCLVSVTIICQSHRTSLPQFNYMAAEGGNHNNFAQ